jgi:hypothetical protein
MHLQFRSITPLHISFYHVFGQSRSKSCMKCTDPCDGVLFARNARDIFPACDSNVGTGTPLMAYSTGPIEAAIAAFVGFHVRISAPGGE